MNDSEMRELSEKVRKLAFNQNEMILSMVELWRALEESSTDLTIKSLCTEKMSQLDALTHETFTQFELSLIDGMAAHLINERYGTIAF